MLALVKRVLAEQVDTPDFTHLIEHRIRLTNPESVRHKFYRMSPGMLETAQSIVDKWREEGIIKRSESDYSSEEVRRHISYMRRL